MISFYIHAISFNIQRLVVDDTQFEGVPCADASGVGGNGGSACVHLLAMLGVWSVFGWLWQVELVLIGN